MFDLKSVWGVWRSLVTGVLQKVGDTLTVHEVGGDGVGLVNISYKIGYRDLNVLRRPPGNGKFLLVVPPEIKQDQRRSFGLRSLDDHKSLAFARPFIGSSITALLPKELEAELDLAAAGGCGSDGASGAGDAGRILSGWRSESDQVGCVEVGAVE